METSYLQISTPVLAIFVGVCLFILSRFIRVPAIVLLLVGGVILGPEFLNVVDPSSLGGGLRIIISLCVAIILFEGGLTLKPEGLKKAPAVIWRLLTLGVLITWFGTASLIYFLLDFSIPMSLLAGSLIIVTGPTVIAPLLKRIQIKEKLYHILHWEGVLVDPIGVFIAILCFEWLTIEGSFFVHVWQFSFRLVIGSIFGYFGGKLITFLLQKEIIPEKQNNIFVFASALFLFVVSDLIVHEAGILTVIIAGLVIGIANPPRLKHIQEFKSDLTEIAIALVFVLLAASLELEHFLKLGWKVYLVLGGVLFVLRPLSVMLCSFRTSLLIKERLFLSWIAPRGVIAGSMASLFGIELIEAGNPEGVFLETFTFSVIACTIILQGGTGGLIARWLKVEKPEKNGWLIVGAHLFSRKIASFITKSTKGTCVFLDNNAEIIREMQQDGLIAFKGNALSTESLPTEVTVSIGHLLALTDNRDLNQLICEKWSEIIDKKNLYRWSSQNSEMESHIVGLGNPIWLSLAKPSQISYEVKSKDILFSQGDKKEGESKNKGVTPLMTERQGRVSFDMTTELLEADQIFLMKRIAWNLSELIYPGHVIFIEPSSYVEGLKEVMKKMFHLFPELPHEQISSALLERESGFPTTLANGVAAPHLHSSGLTEPLCFVAKISNEIELQTYDGDPVRLVFLLLSPESQPEQHLRLLAGIAKITSTPEMVQQLKMAGTEEELIELIKDKKVDVF